MTLKDKLKENDIDTVKEKDLVDKIKNELNDKGENGAKITNKLTLEGEKIVDSIIMNYKNSTHKSTVNRPTTIRRNNTDDKTVVNEDTNKNNEKDKKTPEKNESTNASQSASGDFDWTNIDKKKIRINVNGKNKVENKSPNRRPLHNLQLMRY